MQKIFGENHQVSFSGKVRMIFTDIDGTFLDENKTIRPAVASAAKETVRRNIPFAFATGRMYCAIRDWVEELGMTAPQLVNNGAEILRPSDGSHILHTCFDKATLNWLIDASRASGFAPVVFAGDDLISTEKTEFDWILARNNEYISVVSDEVLRNAASEKYVLLADGEKEPELVKFAERIQSESKPEGVDFKAVFSEKGILNVIPKSCGKLEAIRYLCKVTGCDISEVMAIGDGDNDAEMLSGVGCGVAMGNATAAARAAANFQVDDNVHEGIVQALQFAWEHA